MSKKKSNFKIPDSNKRSRKEIEKENKKLKIDLENQNKKESHNFKILYLLAINLYKIDKDHEIFNNGTFKEEFVEIVKKGAEAHEQSINDQSSPTPVDTEESKSDGN